MAPRASLDRTIRGRLSLLWMLQTSINLTSGTRSLGVININCIDLGRARRFLVGRGPAPVRTSPVEFNIGARARSNAGRSDRAPTGRVNAEFSTRRPGIRRRSGGGRCLTRSTRDQRATNRRGGRGAGDCHHVLEDTAHHASDRVAMTVN